MTYTTTRLVDEMTHVEPHQETCTLAEKMLRSSSSLCSSKILAIKEKIYENLMFDPFPACSTLKSCWVFIQIANLTSNIFPLSSVLQDEPESRSCLLGRDFGRQSINLDASISVWHWNWESKGKPPMPPAKAGLAKGWFTWIGWHWGVPLDSCELKPWMFLKM